MHITANDLIVTLRSNGLRITEARRAVCGVIARSHGDHLDAATIHRRAMNDLGMDLDLSTVYRTLEALEEAGAVRHAHLGEAAVYHLSDEQPHQHLVCRVCGATVAIPASDLTEFLSSVEKLTGFVADVEHFALWGICADCNSA
ncbi:MAG TPA: Fur family transcriptional regulator [Acidimicrobiia bacterium]|nr:Fur family transcriptional regulator [Acidimicrobiia bacterium]